MKIYELLEILEQNQYPFDFYGNKEDEVNGFSDPKSYINGSAVWIGHETDLNFDVIQEKKNIQLLFVKPNEINVAEYKNVVVTDIPKICFMKIVVALYPIPEEAHIENDVIKGENVNIGCSYVGHRVIIGDNVTIGDHCRICSDAYIGKNTQVGNNVVIGEKCVIGGETNGSSFYDVDGEMYMMPNLGGVVIDDDVQIGAGTIICKGTFANTVIGKRCEINAGCTIGHNCVIDEKTLILGTSTIHGNVSVGKESRIISSVIKNRIKIGKNTVVGIGSVVIKDIEDGKECFGNPARVIPR